MNNRSKSLRSATRIVLGAILLSTFSVHARNIHVSLDGSDSASGGAASPYATIAKASTSSAPGDTILIHVGTYRLAKQLEPKSGTSESARITYKAYPGDSVLVHGGSGYVATLASRAYITFEGLRFTTSDTAVGAGMFYFEDSRHIEFKGCEFFNMSYPRGSENTAVIRCMSSGWPDSANIQNSDSCVFRDNFFHENASPAFRLYDTKSWIIENNTFFGCVQAVGGKDEPYDLLIRRNLVVGGDVAFYFPMQGGGNGVTITENIVMAAGIGFLFGGLGTYDNKRLNVNVYNNTFYNVQTWVYGWSDPKYDSAIHFWNNIVHSFYAANIPSGEDVGSRFVCMNKYQSVPMQSSQYLFDYNVYSMPYSDRSTWFIDGKESFNEISTWSAARPPFDIHSYSSIPNFVNIDDTDFHIASGSAYHRLGKAGEELGAYPRGDDGTIIGRRTHAATSVKPARPKTSIGDGTKHSDRRFDGRLATPSKSGIGVVYGSRAGESAKLVR